MNCRILNSLYIRANGEIVCDCDAGKEFSLGKVFSKDEWSINDILDNEKYDHIRISFSMGFPPWKDICINCALFNSGALFVDNLKNKEIRTIQIETSLKCNLSCGGCRLEINKRPYPHLMDLKVFERLLKSCVESGFKVENIEFCGNGEPLSHPNFSDFVRLAHSIMPEAKQILVTNGNWDYKKSLKDQYLDLIYVSCDGLYQSSYEKYRVNGSVSKALKFMADVKSSNLPKIPIVIWKYILFDYNDSDEELKAAQEKAVEIGVDKLMFVFTHTPHESKRFNNENIHEIPIVSPIVSNFSMEKLTHITQIGKPLNSNDSRNIEDSNEISRMIYCVIDDVHISDNNFITIKGWAMDKKSQSIKNISIYCDDQFIGKARFGLREDVLRAYPELKNDKYGFILNHKLSKPLNSPTKIILQLMTNEGITEDFSVNYLFD